MRFKAIITSIIFLFFANFVTATNISDTIWYEFATPMALRVHFSFASK